MSVKILYRAMRIYIAEFSFFLEGKAIFTLQRAVQLESFRSTRPRISSLRGEGPFPLSKGHFHWKTLESITRYQSKVLC